MYAVYEAVKISLTSSSGTFIIIEDPLNALAYISNPYSKNEFVQHIQEMLITTEKHVSFMWVSSHLTSN